MHGRPVPGYGPRVQAEAGADETQAPGEVRGAAASTLGPVRAAADRARRHLDDSLATTRAAADACLPDLLAAADVVAAAFRAGGALLLCGNGGSAADCQHVAAELVARLSADYERPGLPAVALTTDSSFLTAYANDYDFEGVFARQVSALGRPGDVLLGISTSGNSRNVVAAVECAKTKGLVTIVLTGSGGRLAEMADVAVCVPSSVTAHVQETHLVLEHVLCDLVEREVFGYR